MTLDLCTRGPRSNACLIATSKRRSSGLTTGADAPVTGETIVALARAWLGTPYRHQASLKGVGCDCLGLVRGVYAEAYGCPAEQPPPYSRDWAEASGCETMIAAAARHLVPIEPQDARPGDALIFRMRTGAMAKHCGIISSASDEERPGPAAKRAKAGRMPGAQIKIIHAVEGAPVCEVWLTPWWRRRIAAVFRFPDLETRNAESLQQP